MEGEPAGSGINVVKNRILLPLSDSWCCPATPVTGRSKVAKNPAFCYPQSDGAKTSNLAFCSLEKKSSSPQSVRRASILPSFPWSFGRKSRVHPGAGHLPGSSSLTTVIEDDALPRG